jgi:hypothetical protein
MKNEYRDKVIDSLDIITMRTKLISDMIEGKKTHRMLLNVVKKSMTLLSV